MATVQITPSGGVSAPVADASLASPNNATYRNLVVTSGAFSSNTTAAHYVLGSNVSPNNITVASGASVLLSTGDIGIDLLDLVATELAAGSLTTKLRVKIQCSVNGTAPAVNFTAGLYTVTVGGGVNVLAYTFGGGPAAVAGSTALVTAPGANAVTKNNSGDFTIPADGNYLLGVQVSGTVATNSVVHATVQLQHRSV